MKLHKAKSIEDALKKPEEIGELNLFDQVDDLPESLGTLINLEASSVWGENPGLKLPAALAELPRLRSLALNVKVVEIPAVILELGKLRKLALGRFKGEQIPDALGDLDELEELEELEISCLAVKQFPECVTRISGLRRLVLPANHFDSIPESLASLTNLEELDLERSYDV